MILVVDASVAVKWYVQNAANEPDADLAFDTLYHAVALQTPGGILVTADKVYYKKAKSLGQIQLLEEFEFV